MPYGAGGGGGTYKGQVPPPTREVRRRETVTIQGTPQDPPTVNLPTSQTGIMVPYIIGRQRIVSPNIISYVNLQPRYKITREVKTEEIENIYWQGGIKIIEKITVTTIVETKSVVGYTIDMQFGLCLGPDVHLRGIYEDNVQIWSGDIGPARTTINVQGVALDTGEEEGVPAPAELIFSGGAFNQAPDPYLETVVATGVPGYVGIAHVIIKALDVTKGVRNLSFEVERYPNPLALATADNVIDLDINVATMAYDWLTNVWGGVGLATTTIDLASFVTAAGVLADEGNAGSLYVQQEVTGSEVLAILQDQAQAVFFHNPSTGLIEMKLLRSDDYEAVTSPIFDKENVLQLRDIDKSSWVGMFSSLRGTYTNRDGNYSIGAVNALTLTPNSNVGRHRQGQTKDYPAVMNRSLAAELVARDLAGFSVPQVSGVMETTRDGSDLLPGDGFVINWPEYGFTDFKAVVLKRRNSPRANNRSVITFAQGVTPRTTAIFVGGDEGLFEPLDPNPYPPESIVFETAPAYMLQWAKITVSTEIELTRGYPFLLAEAAGPTQVNYDAYITNVPGEASPSKVLSGVSYATVGRLTGAIGIYDGTTTGEIASVDIDGVTRTSWLYNIAEAGVRSGRLFAFINDEILSFESVTNLGGGVYRLNNVHRALLDTVPGAHAEDDEVRIIGNRYDNLAKSTHEIPSVYTPQWRLVGNATGRAGALVDGLVTTDWVVDNRASLPARPHNFKINGQPRSATPLDVYVDASPGNTATWNTRNRTSIVVALQLDAAEAGERNADGVPQVHRVMLRDSANVLHDCGVTADDDDHNSLEFTIPPSAVSGIGTMWVQAETEFGVSNRHDVLPVNIIPPFEYETTEAGDHIVTEAGDSIITEGS
jgi:hypothetical protein